MAKQPYIPLYIGDWERDLNCVSLEAEGAAIKLVFKMWNTPQRGLLSICFSQMAILFKKSEPEARKIFDELRRNNIFDVKVISVDEVEISSRRMLREAHLSKVRSEAGKEGGRPKSESKKQNKSKTKPKAKQIPDNDIDIEDDNEVKNTSKGVQGEKSLHVRLRENFIATYQEKTGMPFFWDGKCAKHLKEIIPKLEGGANSKEPEQVLVFWQILLDNLPNWYFNNGFSPAVINSKFNEIVKQIHKPNATNTTNIDRQIDAHIQAHRDHLAGKGNEAA